MVEGRKKVRKMKVNPVRATMRHINANNYSTILQIITSQLISGI